MNAVVAALLDWDTLARALGGPVLQAGFKQRPEDFCVEEILGFEPDGAGEHLLIHIEKNGLTTFEAQALLARHHGVPLRDTAFAGMKDKQGVTRQWFSVPIRKGSAAVEPLRHPQLRMLHSMPNSRKLRRGAHQANRFRIVLREPAGARDAVLARIAAIAELGVPNYFGAQRFGRGAANVPAALAWFRGGNAPARPQRSLLLSAARSYLFNAHLARRVSERTWNGWIDGDVMALAGSASTFASGRASAAELERRLAEFDVCATGPLWGAGSLSVTGAALRQESELQERYPELCSGLVAQGLEQERRPLRAQVNNLQARFEEAALVLEFELARGSYATCVLRELIHMGAA